MINFGKLNDKLQHHFFTKVELKIYWDVEGFHGYLLRDGKRCFESVGLSVEDVLSKISEKVE